MDIKVFGNINVGLLFGLLQFVTTFLIALFYARLHEQQIRPGGRPSSATEIEGAADDRVT